ncbi:hypothetical protein [Brevundimonas sp. FT23042]|uniref:hypothetical protein n=1 Tax=Brevundimonas sp. FT23042 TaxID=3393749 RepID=UPI003B58A389
MTDVMSEAFGREIVARETFEKEGVWLPLLSAHSMNAGDAVIKGKTFTDCVIQGPAVVAVLGGTTFDGCNMGAASDPTSLLFTPRGPQMVGVIGLQDCRFVRCRFVQIGYTGSPAFLDDMTHTLTNAGRNA